jgi:hypothetical protein
MTNSIDGFTEVPVTLDVKKYVASAEEKDRSHLRWGKTAVTLTLTFLIAGMNFYVIHMVQNIACSELHLVELGKISGADRIIDGKVYLSLIAGTVAEVSALFFIVVKAMFKEK